MIYFVKKLFHTHDIIWDSREYIGKVNIHFTTSGGPVEIEEGKMYLYIGHCIKCNKEIMKTESIALMFDKNQPYDIKGRNDD